MRRRGENISSYEVEQAILGHPAVDRVRRHRRTGGLEAGEDEVLAVVVTAGSVTADELWAWCAGRIPAFAIPRYLRIVDQLPKTPSQKVQKAVLREYGVTPGTHDKETHALPDAGLRR